MQFSCIGSAELLRAHPPITGTKVCKPWRPIAAASPNSAMALSEKAIEQAVWQSAEAGLYVEPPSAGVIADFRLAGEWRYLTGETTVLVLTGPGLKATARIADPIGNARTGRVSLHARGATNLRRRVRFSISASDAQRMPTEDRLSSPPVPKTGLRSVPGA